MLKGLFYFIILICFLLFFFWQAIYSPQASGPAEAKLFSIEKGHGLFQIAYNLEERGVVKNKILFEIYMILKGEAGELKAGKYLLISSMNIPQIAEKFVSGDVLKIKITIPEGFTLEQIDARLTENGLIESNEFINAQLSFINNQLPPINAQLSFINNQLSSLEGFLFPDTYYFSGQENIEQITKIFLDNFDKKLNSELKREIERQDKTIFEIVTMASLIEKEVKTPVDKQIVSGILWKRLNAGMPLQVDATIAYIIGKNTVKISREETKIDSPYNTYKYLGLPLGPICNPGIDSVKAAIYPEKSGFWYYLSTPEGETIFSRTLEEHNIAKAKYLKN